MYEENQPSEAKRYFWIIFKLVFIQHFWTLLFNWKLSLFYLNMFYHSSLYSYFFLFLSFYIFVRWWSKFRSGVLRRGIQMLRSYRENVGGAQLWPGKASHWTGANTLGFPIGPIKTAFHLIGQYKHSAFPIGQLSISIFHLIGRFSFICWFF